MRLSHVIKLNILHQFIDHVLWVHPAPSVHPPSFVLLHGAEDAGVRGASAGVPVVGGVLGALPAVGLLAGLTTVAHRGLALGGGVAGVPGVTSVVCGDVLQRQAVLGVQGGHRGGQAGEGELRVQLWSSASLLAWQQYWLVPCQGSEGYISLDCTVGN